MGLRDLLGVRRVPEVNQTPTASSSSSGYTTLNEDTPSASGNSGGVSDLDPLLPGQFETPSAMAGDLSKLGAGSAQMPYNPYTGLGGPFDPSMSKVLYAISDSPEFLFDEERTMKRRSWSENLTFLTGAGYLGGSLFGGAYGAYLGFNGTPATELHDTTKLKLNRVLNSGGAKGTALGNAWGCLGLYYAAIDSFGSNYVSNGVGHDFFVALVAGAGAGSLYKSMHGLRAMAVYGAFGAGLSGINQVAQVLLGGEGPGGRGRERF